MPRKGENIYKRKDGRWEGRYIKGHCDAKTKYGYIYGKSYSEVKKKLFAQIARIAAEEAKKPVAETTDCSFETVALLWLGETKNIVKESTWVKYHNTLNAYIIPTLGVKPISTINYVCVSSLCNDLLLTGGAKHQGLSAKTVADTLLVVKSSLKYADRLKYSVDRSAFDVSVKLKTSQLRYFSIQEQEILFTYLKGNPDLINVGILISLFTGIRIGELCALTWEDISLATKTMHIHRTMQRIQTPEGIQKTKIIIADPKSQCSIRDIPLPKILLDLLPEPGTADAFVLTGSAEKFVEPRTMQYRFKKILNACQIREANFHALRHTFATRCVEVGFDIKSLSEILGHANVNITLNRYVHPSMDLKKQNMNKLSDLFAVK